LREQYQEKRINRAAATAPAGRIHRTATTVSTAVAAAGADAGVCLPRKDSHFRVCVAATAVAKEEVSIAAIEKWCGSGHIENLMGELRLARF